MLASHPCPRDGVPEMGWIQQPNSNLRLARRAWLRRYILLPHNLSHPPSLPLDRLEQAETDPSIHLSLPLALVPRVTSQAPEKKKKGLGLASPAPGAYAQLHITQVVQEARNIRSAQSEPSDAAHRRTALAHPSRKLPDRLQPMHGPTRCGAVRCGAEHLGTVA